MDVSGGSMGRWTRVMRRMGQWVFGGFVKACSDGALGEKERE